MDSFQEYRVWRSGARSATTAGASAPPEARNTSGTTDHDEQSWFAPNGFSACGERSIPFCLIITVTEASMGRRRKRTGRWRRRTVVGGGERNVRSVAVEWRWRMASRVALKERGFGRCRRWLRAIPAPGTNILRLGSSILKWQVEQNTD